MVKFFSKYKRDITVAAVFVTFLFAPILLIIQTPAQKIEVKIADKKPIIEVEKFTFVEIDKNGTNRAVSGSLGYHFAAKDELFDMEFRQKSGNYIQSVGAKKAQKVGETLFFSGDVTSRDGKGASLKSQNAQYDTKQKRLDIKSDFVVMSPKYTIGGSGASVSNDGKKIVATNIRAKIYTDKK